MAQPNILDYQKFSTELQKNQAENVAKRPGKNSHLAGALDEFTGQLRESGKGRRRNSWEYGVDGLVSGFSAGLKKSDSDASQKVMDYFQANAENIEAQNRYNMEKEQERIKMEPYAMTSLQLMNGDSPYEQVNQQLGSIWQQAQLANPKLKGSFVSYIPNSDMINVRGDDGKVSVVPMASYAGADAYRDIRKDSLERQKIALENDSTTFSNELKTKIATIAQQNADTHVKTAKTSARNTDLKNIAAIDKIVGGKISAKQEFLRDSPRLRAIVESDPEMMQSLAQIQWANQEPGYIQTQIRKISTALNPERAKNLAIASKMINKMQLDVAKGFARPNMFIEKKGSQSVPNFNMTADALVSVLNTMEGDYKSDIDDYNKMAKAIDSTEGHAYTDVLTNPHQGTITPENPLTLTPGEQQAIGKSPMPAEAEQMVPVVDPNGVRGKMPMSKLKGALNDGYSLQ